MDSNRGLKSRQIFNEFSKNERKKWLNKKQIESKTKLESKRNEQILELSAQLAKLKREYNNSLKTVGLAHKSAILVQTSDNEMIECERRRHEYVMNRAKQALISQQKQYIDKQRQMHCSKLKAIETRKQLMKSRIDKNIVDENGKSIIRQMRKLDSDEKRLRKLIDEKLKQLTVSENSNEKSTEKAVINPQKLSSKQTILESGVTDSVNNTEIKRKFVTFNKNDAMIQTEDNSQSDLIANIEKTTIFALKLYEKLKSRHSVVRPKKVFRNIAVNTTPEKLCDETYKIENNADSTISSETSYLSLPKQTPHFLLQTNKFSNMNKLDITGPLVSELTELSDRSIRLNEISKDNVSSFTNNDDLDPLLDRIQRLRCLIDEKVCENSGLNIKQNEIISKDSNLLLSDVNETDSSTLSSSAIFHKLSTIIEAENENTSADINSTKINSIRSSVSTETHKDFNYESTKPKNIINTLQASLPSFSLSNESSIISLESLSKCSEHEFDLNQQNETLESINLSDISSVSESIAKSGLNSKLHSLPNRTVFWKEVFEMSGKTVAEPDIDNFLKNSLQTDEDFETSVKLSSFKAFARRHSTPKCNSLNRFYGTLDDLEITFPDN